MSTIDEDWTITIGELITVLRELPPKMPVLWRFNGGINDLDLSHEHSGFGVALIDGIQCLVIDDGDNDER